MTTASQASKASETRRGVKSTSFKFAPDERELLDRMAEKHGGRKAAIMAGLERLDSEGVTKADVMAWIASVEE